MATRVLRESGTASGVAATVAITSNISTTPVIDFRGWAAAKLFVPAGYSSTSFAIYESASPDGPFMRARDLDNNDASMAIAGNRVSNLPSYMFPSWFIKLVSNLDDSDKPVEMICKA